MKVLYFAWLKQRTGTGQEEIELPAGIGTVGGLLDWLGERHPRLGELVDARGVIRCAVNQRHVERQTPIGPNDEVAFFPPVTGG